MPGSFVLPDLQTRIDFHLEGEIECLFARMRRASRDSLEIRLLIERICPRTPGEQHIQFMGGPGPWWK